LLHLVGYLYYWQMGFNSMFKGLNNKLYCITESSVKYIFGFALNYLQWKQFYKKVYSCVDL